MKTIRLQGLLVLSLTLLFLLGCGPQSSIDKAQRNQLIGRWELQKAYRNGEQAASLEDLYFEFSEEGTMRTNILGSSIQADYLFEGEQIVQSAGDNGLEVAYKLEEISDSSLILTTTLRQFNFKFELRRNTQEEE